MENRNKFHDIHNPSNNSICAYQVKNMLVFDNEVQNDNNNNNNQVFPTKWARLHGSNYAIMFYHKTRSTK